MSVQDAQMELVLHATTFTNSSRVFLLWLVKYTTESTFFFFFTNLRVEPLLIQSANGFITFYTRTGLQDGCLSLSVCQGSKNRPYR